MFPGMYSQLKIYLQAHAMAIFLKDIFSSQYLRKEKLQESNSA